jgi:hypothetical protein
MSNLNDIKQRHGRDHWKDAGFIGLAVLLTALAIGSVTSKAVGSTSEKQWKVTVVESNLEIGK